MHENELKVYLRELESRRYKTKFFLVKLLIELGTGWHSFKEIKKSAIEHEVTMSHLDDNLLELCYDSNFLETDFKEKHHLRLTSFKIRDEAFPLLRNILQET